MACHGNFPLSGKHCVTQSAGELRAPLPRPCSYPSPLGQYLDVYIHALLSLVADGEKEILLLLLVVIMNGGEEYTSISWK